jgi:hypothetical protein
VTGKGLAGQTGFPPGIVPVITPQALTHPTSTIGERLQFTRFFSEQCCRRGVAQV